MFVPGVTTGYQQQYINHWKCQGVQVTISKLDVTVEEDVQSLLHENVGGIFHLAVALKDGLFAKLEKADFKVVCETKYGALSHLDK